MSIKIDASRIGIKSPIEVEQKVFVVDLANEMLLEILENDETQTKREVQQSKNKDATITSENAVKQAIKDMKNERAMFKKYQDFLHDVLRLTPSQLVKATKLLDFDEIIDFSVYVAYRVKGFSDDELNAEKVKKDTESDPKKD